MGIENMRLSLHDGIKKSVMTKKPLLVVEGKDDLSIYKELASEVNSKIDVKPIAYFKSCSPGCAEIERKVRELNGIYPTNHSVYDSFLGIVDRDAKEFRNDISELDGIFYLETYSFENSFVTETTLQNAVKQLTSITTDELNEELNESLLGSINNSLLEFYYITLEALKNAVDIDYDGLVGFSGGYEEALYNPNIKNPLIDRRPSLDQFAENNGIECGCILSFGRFCKGKWHLQYFLNEIKKHAVDLHRHCGGALSQCTYCEINENDSCLYKVKGNIDVSHMTTFMKNDLSNARLSYVKLRLGSLAA